MDRYSPTRIARGTLFGCALAALILAAGGAEALMGVSLVALGALVLVGLALAVSAISFG